MLICSKGVVIWKIWCVLDKERKKRHSVHFFFFFFFCFFFVYISSPPIKYSTGSISYYSVDRPQQSQNDLIFAIHQKHLTIHVRVWSTSFISRVKQVSMLKKHMLSMHERSEVSKFYVEEEEIGRMWQKVRRFNPNKKKVRESHTVSCAEDLSDLDGIVVTLTCSFIQNVETDKD